MEQLVRTRKLACLGALCVGSVALVGCGGSSSPATTTQQATAAHHPQQTAGASSLDTGASQTHGGRQASHGSAGTQTRSDTHATAQAHVTQPDVSKGQTVQKAHSTPSQSGDDHNPVSASGPNPCRLVSLSEAKAITGGAIAASREAPLGPTCVYKLADSKSDITLNVEAASVAKATAHMSKRQQVTVHGHRGYCGTLGASMLYVPLAGAQVLHVTAPCSVAQRFAALALGRLAA